MKKIWRRSLKVFGWISACLFLLASIVGLAWFNPEWLLQPKILHWANEYLLKKTGIELSYKQLKVDFTSDGWAAKKVHVQGLDFRLKTRDINLEIPAFDAYFGFRLQAGQAAVTAFGPLRVRDLKLHYAEAQAELTTESDAPIDTWQKNLSEIEWTGPIQLNVKAIAVQTTTMQLRLGRSQITSEIDKDALFDLKAELQGLEAQTSSLQVQLPAWQSSLQWRFSPEGLQWQSIGPIKAEHARLEIGPFAADKQDASSNTFAEIQAWLRTLEKVRIEPFQLSLDHFVFKQKAGKPISAQLSLELARRKTRQWQLSLHAPRIQGFSAKNGNLELVFNLPLGDEILPLQTQFIGKLGLLHGSRAELKGQLRLDTKESGIFKFGVFYQQAASNIKIATEGKFNASEFSLRLSGEALQPISALKKVSIQNCTWNGKFTGQDLSSVDSTLLCPVTIIRQLFDQEKKWPDPLPTLAQVEIQGPIKLKSWSKAPSIMSTLQIRLSPLQGPYFSLKSDLLATLRGPLFDSKQSLESRINLKTELAITPFQNLVTSLSKTALAVPAPFASLDGSVRCTAEGRLNFTQHGYTIPIQCQTELDSSTQALVILAKGQISGEPDSKPSLELDVSLEKISLELPRFNLTDSMPQFFRDKRIAAIEDRQHIQPASKLPIELAVRIHTPTDSPLKLITTLLPKPVPISIDLSLSGDSPDTEGSISIENYDIGFFKKKAFIQRLGIILKPKQLSPELAGQISFSDPEVKISMKLSGTVERPFYILDSQPPQAPTQLISSILFGGNVNTISDENLKSVEDTRAAMIDGAIGLMSMVYLAATPIESVGYNPQTGMFRARVDLGKGTALIVGSDLEGEKQSISVRRRLSENWSFETGTETSEETKKSRGVAMFRWGRRY